MRFGTVSQGIDVSMRSSTSETSVSAELIEKSRCCARDEEARRDLESRCAPARPEAHRALHALTRTGNFRCAEPDVVTHGRLDALLDSRAGQVYC
jgi:hypothetical protein